MSSLMIRSGEQQMMVINTTDDNETILRKAGAWKELVFHYKMLFIVAVIPHRLLIHSLNIIIRFMKIFGGFQVT